MSTTVVPLAAATPPDLVTVSSSDPSETEVSPSGSNPGDDAGDEPSGGRGPTEDSAVAALLGLRSAWPSSPVEEHGSDGYDHSSGYGADEAQAMWEGQRTSDRRAYGFREDGPYSPRLLRGAMGYDTPDYPSPKRMRAPKDGAPPPGTSRFRCKFPGCSKLYASTDAVRKHCRKRHLEWLRQIDRYSAHERGTPKPALYCVWGDEESEM